MNKKIYLIAILLLLSACAKSHESANTLVVGTIAGPETELMTVAKQVAQQQYGIHVKIIQFSDYNLPNIALRDGSLDANMFQHQPYLTAWNKAHGAHLVAIGKTFIYPMGLYSQKIAKLSELSNGASLAIPNDPSNETRALLLLQKHHLISLKDPTTQVATVQDIVSNPKQLVFKELAAAQLPRVLQDVSAAVINSNYAIPAGLHLKQALIREGKDSPYANIVVVRPGDQHKPALLDLVKALHSQAVINKAHQLFHDDAIVAFR